MMALHLKNDLEVKEALQGSREALNENSRALDSLLECLYGIGGVGRKRIALLVEKAGEDGRSDTGSL